MKPLNLCALFLAAAVIAGCSDDKKSEKPVFEKTEIRVFTRNEITGNTNAGDIIDGQHYIIVEFVYNEENNCQLTDETYVWIESYSENKLEIVDGYCEEAGYMHLPYETLHLLYKDPSVPDYDWHCTLAFVSSDAGPYDFALKFYQPKTGKYYITPRHRIITRVYDERLLTAETSIID